MNVVNMSSFAPKKLDAPLLLRRSDSGSTGLTPFGPNPFDPDSSHAADVARQANQRDSEVFAALSDVSPVPDSEFKSERR
mmetsp:Transcript_24052/g.72164  ORF Transcript_24052/g.72164 Transcript_24052/m.72164 type:complete len:80 (+) Transcript_24052:182-421(+)